MAIKIYPKVTEFPFTVNASEVTSEQVIIDTDEPSSEETEKSLDEYMEDSGVNWQTPMEYYSKRKKIETQGDGYVDISKSDSFDDDRVYFWIEDLHNWCTYECGLTNVNIDGLNETFSLGIKIQLRVWNGVNGWIDINNRAAEDGDLSKTQARSRIPLNKDQDLYHITQYQTVFVDKLNGGNNNTGKYMQYRHRGHCIVGAVDLSTEPNIPGTDEIFLGPRSDALYPYTVINGFRLQKTTKYTINANNFQTKRPKNNQSHASSMALNTDYMVTNVRDFIQTGALPVWRMSTDEIFLATTMFLNTDAGMPYELEYLTPSDSDGAFGISLLAAVVVKPREDFIKESRIQMYDEYRKFTSRYSLGLSKFRKELVKFINNKCLESFGNGTDKSIKKDWLREYNIAKNVNAPSDYNNMLDSNLRFEQVNSNDTNTMKCSFKVNRPIVITDEQETTDYIKKW